MTVKIENIDKMYEIKKELDTCSRAIDEILNELSQEDIIALLYIYIHENREITLKNNKEGI